MDIRTLYFDFTKTRIMWPDLPLIGHINIFLDPYNRSSDPLGKTLPLYVFKATKIFWLTKTRKYYYKNYESTKTYEKVSDQEKCLILLQSVKL